MNYVIGFLPFILLLLVLYIARVIRQQKAKTILEENMDKTKLYIDNGKTVDDGIIVKSLNGAKPVVGRDDRGNYVIVNIGINTLSVSFRALKDFAAGVAVGSVSGVMPIKEFDDDITCLAQRNIVYRLSLNKETRVLEVKPIT